MAVLRSLTLADLDELLEVQREGAVAGLGHIFPQDTHPFPADRIRDRWEREVADPGIDCFAIVEDGRLAGFAGTRGEEFFHFGTALATWGTGLASRAHDEVLDHLRRQGAKSAWLRVLDENERAARFYRRRGWLPTEITSRTGFPPHPTLRRYERNL